jgi:hypothetical protein
MLDKHSYNFVFQEGCLIVRLKVWYCPVFDYRNGRDEPLVGAKALEIYKRGWLSQDCVFTSLRLFGRAD